MVRRAPPDVLTDGLTASWLSSRRGMAGFARRAQRLVVRCGQPVNACTGGGQCLTGRPVVMSAQPQVHRILPAAGGRHHDLDQRPGRTAAGPRRHSWVSRPALGPQARLVVPRCGASSLPAEHTLSVPPDEQVWSGASALVTGGESPGMGDSGPPHLVALASGRAGQDQSPCSSPARSRDGGHDADSWGKPWVLGAGSRSFMR